MVSSITTVGLWSGLNKGDSPEIQNSKDRPEQPTHDSSSSALTHSANALGKTNSSPEDHMQRAVSTNIVDSHRTGWQSDLEWSAIIEVQLAGKKVVSLLDNWVNYESRFIRDDQKVLPDEIWVADTKARDLAVLNFPSSVIRLIPIPHLYERVRTD